MKKSVISFLAGFLVAVVVLSIYSKLTDSSQSETEKVEAPVAANSEQNISDEVNPLASPELMRMCPAFCENRPDRLKAPTFAKDLPEELKSDFAGGVGLRWEPVKDAVRYRAIIFDNRGERMMALTTKGNRLFFPNLPKAPIGESFTLKVAVVAIDKNETEGKMSEKRKLVITGTVPLVRAPKVKMIKVED